MSLDAVLVRSPAGVSNSCRVFIYVVSVPPQVGEGKEKQRRSLRNNKPSRLLSRKSGRPMKVLLPHEIGPRPNHQHHAQASVDHAANTTQTPCKHYEQPSHPGLRSFWRIDVGGAGLLVMR